MQRNRPVPGIARGPQQFSPSNLPPIPSPMAQRFDQTANQPPQVPPEFAVQAELQDMAMEIYCRLAVSAGSSADSNRLRELADYARTAARAYFESMGVTFPS